jgi:hypothetical protein
MMLTGFGSAQKSHQLFSYPVGQAGRLTNCLGDFEGVGALNTKAGSVDLDEIFFTRDHVCNFSLVFLHWRQFVELSVISLMPVENIQ